MGHTKLFQIKVLFIAVFIFTQSMMFTSCDQKSNSDLNAANTPAATSVSDIEVKSGDKDDYGGTVIAVDNFDNEYNLGALRSISKDGRYYLFQQAQYDNKTHEPSKKAKLVIWDSIDKKAVNSIEGEIAAVYMRNSVLDMENRRVYYGDMYSVNYIDLKRAEKVDVLSKYKIKPGKEFVDESGNLQYNIGFIAFDNGALFVRIIDQREHDNLVYNLYQIKDEKLKNININIKTEIDYMEILGTIEGSRLMLQINSKFYITDFDGNVIEERPLIKNKDFENLGSSYMYPSYDGKKLLYSLCKTPTDLYMYNFETKEVKVLCPGGRNDLGMTIPSITEKYGESYDAFWTGNSKVIAIIGFGDLMFDGTRRLVAKEYTIE